MEGTGAQMCLRQEESQTSDAASALTLLSPISHLETKSNNSYHSENIMQIASGTSMLILLLKF